MRSALPPADPSIERRDPGELSPDAIPPRRQGRHRARQGFWIPTHPPPPPIEDAPPSPDYSPGSTTDEEDETSTDNFETDDSSFWSMNDSPTAPQPQSFNTMTLLRANRAMPPSTSD
ncbi:hypothetical protein CYMTET_50313 [Cymbomonas tetramitiformis]|uniref:Uncharacterized protein n=1 Tax=Cymbomonas tetramitiformis TaxID=36881 RepID=A0AAE0ESY7_9CHLO|nr:hypothetical protein CYMTET_50313 [Cymbomonas tetramitiformis]